MTIVGLHGAGHMGSGLGWALREGGARVVTTLDGRSARTARLVQQAGLTVLPRLADVLREAETILVVTPPSAAIVAAAQLAAVAAHIHADPVIADLNAISPASVAAVAATVAPLEFVDGSISGAPPTVRSGARIYLSGPRAEQVAALPWRHVTPLVVGPTIGTASAVKMCTASVYKGLTALYTQAMRTAASHGVLDIVLDDLAEPDAARRVALAASKADRYVPEMREIAATQAAAGLTPSLFQAMAEVYEGIAATPLAVADPESVRLNEPAAVVSALQAA